MKICTKCSIEKSLDDFQFCSVSKGTKMAICRECNNTRKNAIWPFTHKIKARIANEVQTLTNHEEVML
jgi:hypothetical protein